MGALLRDDFAKAFEHRRKVVGELSDGFSEVANLRPFVSEERFQQMEELARVFHADPSNLALVLNQNGGASVLVDDVVAGAANRRFLANLFVEVVVGVLGFPIAERHADRVDQGPVDISPVACGCDVFMFSKKNQVARFAPALE